MASDEKRPKPAKVYGCVDCGIALPDAKRGPVRCDACRARRKGESK